MSAEGSRRRYSAENVGPWLGLIALAIGLTSSSPVVLGLAVISLFLGVVAAIHHAEVIAHRVGEPFGTLVLAVAITTIETALVLSLMLANPEKNAGLPRDTILSALMIICCGVMGICIFAGGLKHREQVFRVEGATSALAALVTLSVLTLILPRYTTTTAGPTYSPPQLIVIAVISLLIWGTFVAIQTGRHRDYFLPAEKPDDLKRHADPPTLGKTRWSVVLLLICLIAVVGLAKVLSKPMEGALDAAGAPKAVLGAIVALIVLLPETGAAVRAARANRLQTSLNLALGSGLASIGLTIPVVAAGSLLLGIPLELGVGPKEAILLALTFAVNMLTLGLGRSNILLGAVHLALFATFVLTTLVP